MIRTGLCGTFYYGYKGEPVSNIIGNYFGLYIRVQRFCRFGLRLCSLLLFGFDGFRVWGFWGSIGLRLKGYLQVAAVRLVRICCQVSRLSLTRDMRSACHGTHPQR